MNINSISIFLDDLEELCVKHNLFLDVTGSIVPWSPDLFFYLDLSREQRYIIDTKMRKGPI